MSEAEDASGKSSNLTAVEAISARLAEVTRLAEKLDAKLCEAGARTRPVPMSSSLMSSNSSLFSSTSNQAHQLARAAGSVSSSSTGDTAVVDAATSVSTTVPSSITLRSSDPVSEPTLTNENSTMNSEPEPGEAAEVRYALGDDDVPVSGSPLPEDSERQQEEDLNREVIEKSFDESAADDSNMDGYVTATECSMTPTARSRSESFVTSPECEDLAALATVTSTLACSSCLNTDEPKTLTSVSSAQLREESFTKEENVPKPDDGSVADGEKAIEKVILMEKTVEEKSGKIVKEVTETTTLRVSHDTRLGVASYKVTSNTLQDHHENVDVKELKNLERIVSPAVQKKMNGLHSTGEDVSLLKIADTHSACKKPLDERELEIKVTKEREITEEETSRLSSRDTKDISLSLNEYTRHHEDSGIEMSPTKRDDTLEGDEFLERARTVSSCENARESRGCYDCNCNCNSNRNCNCNNVAACVARYTTIPSQPSFVGLAAAGLVNENQRRLPLPNPS